MRSRHRRDGILNRYGDTRRRARRTDRQWRSWLRRRPDGCDSDAEELEGRRSDLVTARRSTGLDAEEAFLVDVKRMGDFDHVSREFAREHSGFVLAFPLLFGFM